MTSDEKKRLYRRAKYWKCDSVFEDIVKRDLSCIYCGLEFEPSDWKKASIEHIDNNMKNVTVTNIAICCRSCNSSKGQLQLADWVNKGSPLVIEKNIKEKMAGWVRELI